MPHALDRFVATLHWAAVQTLRRVPQNVSARLSLHELANDAYVYLRELYDAGKYHPERGDLITWVRTKARYRMLTYTYHSLGKSRVGTWPNQVWTNRVIPVGDLRQRALRNLPIGYA